MRRRIVLIIVASLLLALSLPVALVYWLAYTEAGLQWLAGQTTRLKTVRIQVEGLHGRLVGPWSAKRVEIDHERIHMVVTDIKSEVILPSVLLQTIHLDKLNVGAVDMVLKPRVSPPNNRPPFFLPAWLQLRADRFHVGPTSLKLLNGQVLTSTQTSGDMHMSTRQLRVRELQMQAEQLICAGSGEVRAATPFGVGGELQCTAQLAEQPRYAAKFQAQGDLNRLQVKGTLLEPFVAKFDGALLDLTQQWHWEVQASTPAVNLKPWSPTSTLGNIAATVTAAGDASKLRSQGTVNPSFGPTGPIEFSFQGTFAKRQLLADRLELAPAGRPGKIVSRGAIIFAGGPPTLHLQGTWTQLYWPLNKPTVNSPRGEFTLDGKLPYDYTMRAEVSVLKNPPLQVSGRGQLEQQAISFAGLNLQETDKRSTARISGSGRVSWSAAQDWQLKLSAKQFDPARFYASMPGKLDFNLNASGRGFQPTGPWTAQITDLNGRLRAQAISGRARISREGKLWKVEDTLITSGTARLQVNGRYDDQPSLQWSLSAPDLKQLLPEARGSIDFRGRLSGTADQPQLSSSLIVSRFKYQDYGVAEIRGTADLDLTDKQASHVQLDASDIVVGGRQLRNVQLSASGTGKAHTVQLDLNAINVRLELTATGGYVPRSWQGNVSAMRMTLGRNELALEAPLPLFFSAERIEVGQFCLAGDKERACGNGRWQNNGNWTAALKAKELPLRLFALGMTGRTQYSGRVAVDAQATGTPGQPWTGNAVLDFAEGKFYYIRSHDRQEQVSVGSGRAELNAQPQRFVANVKLNAEEISQIEAHATVERQGTDWRKFPLSGTLNARTSELGFLPVLVPEIDRASGELTAKMNFDGQLGAPRFGGQLGLDKGELDLYTVNMLLREITATVQLTGNELQLTGKLRAGEGTAEMDGKLSWTDGKPKGTLDFKGENLVIANVPEARVHASPNITLTIEGQRIEVDGAVRVPYARLAPANLTGAVLPSEDEVIVGAAPIDPDKRFYITTGIHLILGKDVRLDSYGLSGKITGGIVAYTATDEVSTGTGELKIEEGKYTAYARELNIERGRLVFTGGALNNPGVDMRATRKFPETLAGINVRGTLRDPRVTFFSEPPLPQTQIASLLVAGRTFDSLQSNTGQNAGQARDQLIAQGGALLAKQLGSRLGIDEVSVESGTDTTSLVLGKYLSPRLYVGYGISLAETINTLKLRYTLGDRWTIKLEAGEFRSADVVYAIDR